MPRGTTPFIQKTWELLSDKELEPIVSWNRKGDAFAIIDADVFATEVLPQYFKHSNMSSFVRQLNTYGFKKVTSKECREYEFKHKLFLRDHEELLPHITRRAGNSQEQGGTNPTQQVDLLQQLAESNKRLIRTMEELEGKLRTTEADLSGIRQELGETRNIVLHHLNEPHFKRNTPRRHSYQQPCPVRHEVFTPPLPARRTAPADEPGKPGACPTYFPLNEVSYEKSSNSVAPFATSDMPFSFDHPLSGNSDAGEFNLFPSL